VSPVNDVQYVDSPDELDALCAALTGAEWIALDTEFLREKTYYPKLCLLQLATPDIVACVDPLVLDDLSPLLDFVFDERITKVMHSGRQDMEIFFHLRGSLPAPVFDTQIAALLLGYPEQVGYANLVKAVLGTELDKLHTRADWSLRPLSAEQLQYAADDVIYLVEVYREMHAQLEKLGRLEWLADDFAALVDPALYENSPEQAWLKVKGSNRLRGDSLAILQELAGWRETTARSKDRPKGWILRDDVLIEIARHKPRSLAELGKLRGLSEGLLRNSGNKIIELVNAAAGKSPVAFPDTGRRARLSPDQGALVDVMSAIVRLISEQHGLNPAVLASRKQLESLILGDREAAVLQGWRKKLVGERLQAFLDGELRVVVNNGRLAIDA
jgi:ribonuclease D